MSDWEVVRRLAAPTAPAVRRSARSRRRQAKLTVGAAADPLEREADDIADLVMRRLTVSDRTAADTFGADRLTRIRRADDAGLPVAGAAALTEDERPGRVRRASGGLTPASPDVVQREDLADLVVKTGSLPDLSTETSKEWANLSPILKKFHKDIPFGPMDIADVGVLSVTPNPTEIWTWELGLYGKRYNKELGPETLESIKKVVKGLMEANGQMKYIRAKPWFQPKSSTDQYHLEIDVNFYPNRGLSQDREMFFHKDTGGNNIFVNLIFNNSTEMPATEYLIDVHNPSPARDKHQTRILPPQHREELMKARQKLKLDPRAKQETPISGGVVGPMNYLSWVDDLVWHETPQLAPRAFDTEGTAKSVFTRLTQEIASTGKIPTPYFYPLRAVISTPTTKIHLAEKLVDVYRHRRAVTNKEFEAYGLVGEIADLQFRIDQGESALAGQRDGLQQKLVACQRSLTQSRDVIDKTLRLVAKRFTSTYRNVEDFWADCQLVAWRNELTGWSGEAIADDDRLGRFRGQISERVKGAEGGRRRANSLPASLGGQQEKVQAAYDKARAEPRSFIRTWVRVVKTTTST